jgi:hypothetical protein
MKTPSWRAYLATAGAPGAGHARHASHPPEVDGQHRCGMECAPIIAENGELPITLYLVACAFS